MYSGAVQDILTHLLTYPNEKNEPKCRQIYIFVSPEAITEQQGVQLKQCSMAEIMHRLDRLLRELID
jgi:hypothetical protein